jgi:PilZ domain
MVDNPEWIDNPRRNAVMLGLREQRQADRNFVIAPAAIDIGGESHVGLVRDVSSSGMFVYSDFIPDCGTTIQLKMQLRVDPLRAELFDCEGTVVRVQGADPGAAVGIAVKLHNFNKQEHE